MEQPRAPVLCITDGHAGNRRQAEALAHALGHADAPHFTLAPTRLARALAPRRFPGAAAALGAAFSRQLKAPPRLAIGCGRQAALATRLLRAAGSRVIQILDPRIDPRHWDRVVAPLHDGLSGDNVVPVLGSLHAVDDLWLAQARQDFPAFATLPTPRIALLLGGPSRHWAMDDAALDALLSRLHQRVGERGGTLLATASRRTPMPWRERLAALAAAPDVALAWRDERDGANPYRGLLGWADVIVCTADSVNMLSEACATEAPVVVIGGEALHGRPRHFLDALLSRGRVRRFQTEVPLDPLDPLDARDAAAVTPLRETARIAAELRGWLDGAR